MGKEVAIGPCSFEEIEENHYQTAQTFRKLYASTFSGIPTVFRKSAHIGHGAIIHSAHDWQNCFGWDERCSDGQCQKSET